MDQKFLGESYDLVKRFWAENLSSIAPIYADEIFVPKEIHKAYTQVTGIPNFHASVAHPFAIFLDPCIGIPSPKNTARKPTKKHAPLPFIKDAFKNYHPEFLICFDQSYSRNGNKESCMEEKLNALKVNGLCAFYYTSHANFLFVSESAEIASSIRKRLLDLGIPSERLKPNESYAATLDIQIPDSRTREG
jgi:hypothetical protein